MVDAKLLGRAIVIWTGYGETSWPARDDARVIAALGEQVARSVLPIVRSLEDDFYTSDAQHVGTDLADMARRASADFVRLHPEIPETPSGRSRGATPMATSSTRSSRAADRGGARAAVECFYDGPQGNDRLPVASGGSAP